MGIRKVTCLFIIWSLISCSPEDTDTVTFRMFNDTDYQVRILAFNRSRKILIDEINIESNGVHITKKIRNNTGNFLNEAFYASGEVDSIRMIFDSNRVNIFLQNLENNDLFFGDQNREYRITDDEFNNAEDCNQNCE